MLVKHFFPSISLFIVLAFAACSPARNAKSTTADADLQQLASWMTGDFSSQAQSQRDSDYYDIRLHIHPIWPQDKGNIWFYVEQATAAAQDKPYRQRVYKLERADAKTLISKVYTLPDPTQWIGAYKDPARFDKLQPSALLLREGCGVFLEKNKDGSYSGGTRGEGCESTLRGAKYASSSVIVTEKMLRSWDQGFNEKKEQVWGATKGGYDFVKQ